MCVDVCVCMCVCMRVCVYACVCMCVCVCPWTAETINFALFNRLNTYRSNTLNGP